MNLKFKLHGNYCGPQWTRGKNHPEARMFELPFVAPIDELDYACMMHDEDIAKNGTSRSSDLRLAKRARKIARTNIKLAPLALMVAHGMEVAASQRKNQD
mgnify:CR=1 FL=1